MDEPTKQSEPAAEDDAAETAKDTEGGTGATDAAEAKAESEAEVAPAALETESAEAEGPEVSAGEEATPKKVEAPKAVRSLPAWAHLLLGFVLPAIALVVNHLRVAAFTVDDAYISFRYARNLAKGWGLVYNEGGRIEGYTNFLWTVILAGGIKVGLDPDSLAKWLGGACSVGALYATYRIAEKLRGFDLVPCLATWLLASTVVFSGYAVFGLETPLFVFLIMAGLWLFLREEPSFLVGLRKPPDAPPPGLPWSGLVFGLAGLTRPEAPLYIGVLALFLGLRIIEKRNLIRGALFVAPVAAHLAFRRAYYGPWVPNTLTAKTGDGESQIRAGMGYVEGYLNHAGPVIYLGLFAIAIGLLEGRRVILAITALGLLILGYVVLVGGDWMPYFRFVAPFEPLCFLLVDLGARTIGDRGDRAAQIALAACLVFVTSQRIDTLAIAQKNLLTKDKGFWDKAAGGLAKWFVDNNKPGSLALGDIGYVGYVTDYPIVDMLGLVDPVIASLPGGYTPKLSPAFNDHFFEKAPRYFLVISSSTDCRHPSVPNSKAIYGDPRFLPRYALAGKVNLDGGFAWCVYESRAASPAAP